MRTKTLQLLSLFLCCNLALNAQDLAKKLKNAKGIEVTYQTLYKGKVIPDEMIMRVKGDEVSLTSSTPQTEFPKTESFLNYSSGKFYRRAVLSGGKVISTITLFKSGEGFKDIGKEKFLGLDCTLLRTSINSNTIDVWYTTAIPFRGTPQAGVGVPDGLVLKIVRNGDMIQQATSIVKLKDTASILPTNWGEEMDASYYQYSINNSNVITVPVFLHQSINFTGAKLPAELKGAEVYNAGGGTIILKKVKLPDNVKDRSIFAEVAQYSDGDAYDRTGSIFMIPVDKKLSFLDAMRDLKSVPSFKAKDGDYPALVSDSTYDVPVELMRFFTGFGVRKFNNNKVPGQNWVDSVLYKSEITPLAERLKGEVWIGAYIGNWDAKGHKLSLTLKYYPEGERRAYHTIPLFNTLNYLEQAGQKYPLLFGSDSLRATFTIEEPIKNALLLYTTTGHGGWGNGDEFNQKPNSIFLDGQKVITFIPWRDDCGTYRNWNPCSGNFSNGLSSSDLSRSNWCPGTVTNPEYIYLGDLSAGTHTISVEIPQGAPEGGSNSYWCVSGTLLY